MIVPGDKVKERLDIVRSHTIFLRHSLEREKKLIQQGIHATLLNFI